MKKMSRTLMYILVGVFSFIFFLYLSFPYNVLKETLSAKIASSANVSVAIDDLSSKLPLGLKAEKIIVFSPSGGKQFTLKAIKMNVSLLSLLIGRVTVDATILDEQKGNLNLSITFKIFDLIAGNAMPKSLDMRSKNFQFGDIVSFFLAVKANAEGTNALLKPLLSKVDISGKLNSDISLSLDADDFSQSKGDVMIAFAETSILFDKSLQLPDQQFEKSMIKTSVSGGNITFDKDSAIKSKDLELLITGKVTQKAKIDKSIWDLMIAINLGGPLKDQIGFMVDTMANRTNSDGKFKVKITGTLAPQLQINLL